MDFKILSLIHYIKNLLITFGIMPENLTAVDLLFLLFFYFIIPCIILTIYDDDIKTHRYFYWNHPALKCYGTILLEIWIGTYFTYGFNDLILYIGPAIVLLFMTYALIWHPVKYYATWFWYYALSCKQTDSDIQKVSEELHKRIKKEKKEKKQKIFLYVFFSTIIFYLFNLLIFFSIMFF